MNFEISHRAVAKIIIFNCDYHFPLLSAIYESNSCVTDAHCFLFRTIKCQSCLIDMKFWSLKDKNDYLLDFIHLVYSPRGIHSRSISN